MGLKRGPPQYYCFISQVGLKLWYETMRLWDYESGLIVEKAGEERSKYEIGERIGMVLTLSPAHLLLLFAVSALLSTSLAFQSDELLLDDEEFGLEGGVHTKSPDLTYTRSSSTPPAPAPALPSRRRPSDQDTDSKIQFELHHAFGDSDFSPAGSFGARLKSWSHGGQVRCFVFALFPC